MVKNNNFVVLVLFNLPFCICLHCNYSGSKFRGSRLPAACLCRHGRQGRQAEFKVRQMKNGFDPLTNSELTRLLK